MPTYNDPLHGVSYSEAYAEAMAIAPIGRAMLDTLEITHPDLAAPIRLVIDTQDLDATLEADAPFDPGEEVTFTAVRFGLKRPDETDTDPSPQAEFWIDGVSSAIAGQLEAVVQTLVPIVCTVRTYASDDTSGPANLPPMRFELKRISVTETRVSCVAGFGNTANKRFPAKSFTPAEYPGLAAR